MKIAIAGLGRMGSQIARKLAEGGHDVVAQNRSREPIDAAVKYGAKPAYEKTDVVKAFISEKLILWLMVPAEIVDTQLNEWLGLIPKGSIIIDGGNSDFRLTKIRADNVRFSGDELIDVGTSGGVWGYKNGFCMMASGEKRWTLETAKELGIPLPAIQKSFDVRLASQKGDTNFATKLLAAMRAK